MADQKRRFIRAAKNILYANSILFFSLFSSLGCVDESDDSSDRNDDAQTQYENNSCSTLNCAGCCYNGICYPGDQNEQCGVSGELCFQCNLDEYCEYGECFDYNNSELCNRLNCIGCCNNGRCESGNDDYLCGRNGAQCLSCESNKFCSNGICNIDSQESCSSQNCGGCCVGSGCNNGDTHFACGKRGQQCQECTSSESCINGDCLIDPNSTWKLGILSAVINTTNTTVDGDGSDPDVFICINIDGYQQKCTSTKLNTYSPRWNEVVGRFKASSLMNEWSIYFTDEDAFSNDNLGGCLLQFNQNDFNQSVLNFGVSNCTYNNVSSVNMSLELD